MSKGGPPSRHELSGPYLDALHKEVKEKVDAYINAFLTSGGQMTFVLDGWDDTNRAHVVNFIAVLKEAAIFLDSKCVVERNQNAEAQAEMVSGVLEQYGGVNAFAAVLSENTQSCFKMRDVVAGKYPGIVSLNDQSHVANLGLSDIQKTPFGNRVLEKALQVNNFVLQHQYALAYFRKVMVQCNKSLKALSGESEPVQ